MDGSDLVVTNWYGYGEPVYAPADGQVVTAVDGLPCDPIGNREMVHLAGNHVVIDIGNDRQVFLAHLMTGSVTVEEGEVVTSGALIGRVGNSETAKPRILPRSPVAAILPAEDLTHAHYPDRRG